MVPQQAILLPHNLWPMHRLYPSPTHSSTLSYMGLWWGIQGSFSVFSSPTFVTGCCSTLLSKISLPISVILPRFWPVANPGRVGRNPWLPLLLIFGTTFNHHQPGKWVSKLFANLDHPLHQPCHARMLAVGSVFSSAFDTVTRAVISQDCSDLPA